MKTKSYPIFLAEWKAHGHPQSELLYYRMTKTECRRWLRRVLTPEAYASLTLTESNS